MTAVVSRASAPSLATVKDVASRYAVSPNKIRKWVKAGALVAIDVATGGGVPRFRFTQEALDKFEASRSTRPPAPKPARKRRGKTSDAKPFF